MVVQAQERPGTTGGPTSLRACGDRRRTLELTGCRPGGFSVKGDRLVAGALDRPAARRLR
jgi:hypothetical protein